MTYVNVFIIFFNFILDYTAIPTPSAWTHTYIL